MFCYENGGNYKVNWHSWLFDRQFGREKFISPSRSLSFLFYFTLVIEWDEKVFFYKFYLAFLGSVESEGSGFQIRFTVVSVERENFVDDLKIDI